MKTSIKLIALIAISFFTMLQISCKSDDDNDGDGCEDVYACPDVAIGIYVYIVDVNQEPVALDSYEVTDMASGEVLTTPVLPFVFEGYQEEGRYPVSTGALELHQERDVLFKGFINDTEVISSNYRVGRGCCHIGLVSGDVNLVLE
jgi:hypothetical protein